MTILDNRTIQSLQFFSDLVLTSPSTKMANLLTEAGGKTWFYIFTHAIAKNYSEPQMKDKAYHQYELHFVFGTPYQGRIYADLTQPEFADVDREIANTVMTLWTNFAKYGYVAFVCRYSLRRLQKSEQTLPWSPSWSPVYKKFLWTRSRRTV